MGATNTSTTWGIQCTRLSSCEVVKTASSLFFHDVFRVVAVSRSNKRLRNRLPGVHRQEHSHQKIGKSIPEIGTCKDCRHDQPHDKGGFFPGTENAVSRVRSRLMCGVLRRSDLFSLTRFDHVKLERIGEDKKVGVRVRSDFDATQIIEEEPGNRG